jgi:hypothetical protein
VGNDITLKVPWAGAAIAAGTSVSGPLAGPGFMYAFAGLTSTTTWQQRDNKTTPYGGLHNGNGATPTFKFPYGTTAVKAIALTQNNGRVQYAGLSLEGYGHVHSSSPGPAMIQVDDYATPGTFVYTKPAGATRVEVSVLNAGCGGGSGRRGAAGTARFGGGGGAAGLLVRQSFKADDLPASVTVRVAAGGAGAAAQTVDNTDGTTGAPPAVWSYFGATILIAPRHSVGGGFGGTAAAGTGGTTIYGTGTGFGAGSVASITTAPAALAAGTVSAAGGNAGGSITAANVPMLGGVQYNAVFGGLVGTPGVVDGASPTAGTPPVGLAPGLGGSGGWASITKAAANGTDAAGYGGGGGGGGASLNGFNSGAGGKGGDGYVRVVTYF